MISVIAFQQTEYSSSRASFAALDENETTELISKLKNQVGDWSSELSYTYDSRGNIETISENGTQKVRYHYDELNQLIREDNIWNENKTITYTYDNGGNILSVKEYAYTTADNLSSIAPDKTHTYTYDNEWKDKLASYNGNAITYDEIGNPETYKGYTYTWQNGRELAGVSGNGLNASYKYNADGIRTSKTVDGKTTTYTLEGTDVVYETNGTDSIWYNYDASGALVSMTYNGTTYYYVTNLQGDVVALTDSNRNVVVNYIYDSWGKPVSTTGSQKDTIGVINPYRYRGYRYDIETGLYYLQSRYYNPEMKRFINADIYVDTGDTTLSTNMFAYCENNSIMYMDSMGYATCPTGALNVIYKTGHMSKNTKAICSEAKSLGNNLTRYTFTTKHKKKWLSFNKYGYYEYIFTVKSMTVGKWAESLVKKYKGYYWFKKLTAPMGLLDAFLASTGNAKLEFAVNIICTIAGYASAPYEVRKYEKLIKNKPSANTRLYMVKSFSVNYVTYKSCSTQTKIISKNNLAGKVYF